MDGHTSFFDRIICQPRSIKFYLVMIITLVFSLILAVFLDGRLDELTQDFSWRGLLIPPTITVYIFTIAPIMSRMEKRVLNSLHVLIENDSEFQKIIRQTSEIKPLREFSAIGIGLIIGLISGFGSIDGDFSWISLYWLVTSIIMFVLLIWTIFISIYSTRVTSTLLRQPLKVNPFNTSTFEPIGRQSLVIAIVFIGGISLSLIFIGLDLSSLKQPIFWFVYIPLAIVPVALFFLNMAPTHKVLANAKATELAAVQKTLQSACRKLLALMDNDLETNSLSGEINALAIYEKQLKETRTWPYNTAMFRTLFFSVLIPIGTLIGRIIIEALAN